MITTLFSLFTVETKSHPVNTSHQDLPKLSHRIEQQEVVKRMDSPNAVLIIRSIAVKAFYIVCF